MSSFPQFGGTSPRPVPVHSASGLPSASNKANHAASNGLSHLSLQPRPRIEAPLAFVYRSNPTYDRLVPLLERVLVHEGANVMRVPFPSDCSVRTMRERLHTLEPVLRDRAIVSDQTIGKLLPQEWLTRAFLQSAQRAGELDYLMRAATHQAVSQIVGIHPLQVYANVRWHSDDHAGYRSFLAGELQAMEQLFRFALAKHPVDLVVIFPHHLNEHLPFGAGPADQDCASFLKEVFERVGIGTSNILVADNLRKIDLDRVRASKFSLCVGDRHILTTETLDKGLNALISSWLEGTRIGDGRASHRRSKSGAQLEKAAWIDCALGEHRELLGIDEPLAPDPTDDARRVWLCLPLEELLGSLIDKKLIRACDLSDDGNFIVAFLAALQERVMLRSP